MYFSNEDSAIHDFLYDITYDKIVCMWDASSKFNYSKLTKFLSILIASKLQGLHDRYNEEATKFLY